MGIKNLMTVIAIGGFAVFVMDFTRMSGDIPASILLRFDRNAVLSGEYWRLLTFIFVPPGGSLLTPLVLFFYHWMGRLLEAQWGRLKLNFYYLTGILLVLAYGFISGAPVTAVELNLSLLLAVGTLFPDMQIRLMMVIPVKIKWLAAFSAAVLALGALLSSSLLPFVPVGNYLLYFAPYLKPILFKPGRSNTVRFKREVRRMQDERKVRDYFRKCAVCGLTDAEDPGMEFRFCSLCTGRKCYCSKHLFDHEHS
jgi:hypothetical protein